MSYYNQYDPYRPSGSFSLFPPIIKYLLIINISTFLLQLFFERITIGGYPIESYLIYYLALQPLDYNFLAHQLISYQFLHGNFTHLFFNMFALWMFGIELEYWWGSKRFLFFYLTCGIFAGLMHLFISPILTGNNAPTIGASGSVYGILVAFAMYFPDRPIYLYFLLPIKAKYLIGFYIILEFLSVGSASYVAHLAHLGGALCGFLLVMAFRRNMFDIEKWFRVGKSKFKVYTSSTYEIRNPKKYADKEKVKEAYYVDLNSNEEDLSNISQEEIDRILDKISESGYSKLTEREKRILFEASKRK
jgi:membrane associated rhomboid family serine protease